MSEKIITIHDADSIVQQVYGESSLLNLATKYGWPNVKQMTEQELVRLAASKGFLEEQK